MKKLMLNRLFGRTEKNYRFLMTSFSNQSMKLIILKSEDGIHFDIIGNEVYVPELGNKTLRDPSMQKLEGMYYITYTVIDWKSGNTIGMCRTADFVRYEELPQIEVGDFNKVWAPAFYYEKRRSYIIFNASGLNGGSKFKSYAVRYDPRKHCIDELSFITVLPGNVIDTHIYKEKGKYYLFYKNEDTKYVELAVSSNLFSGYKPIRTNNWAGWGKGLEGQTILKLKDGTYRIYLDNYEENQIYYSNSKELTHGWSELHPIMPHGISHPEVHLIR